MIAKNFLLVGAIMTMGVSSGANASNCAYNVTSTTDDVVLTVRKLANSGSEDGKEVNSKIASQIAQEVNYGDTKEVAIPIKFFPLQEGVRSWKNPDSSHKMIYQNGIVSIKTSFTFGRTDSLTIDGEVVQFAAAPDLSEASVSHFNHDKTFAKQRLGFISENWPDFLPEVFDKPLKCEN